MAVAVNDVNTIQYDGTGSGTLTGNFNVTAASNLVAVALVAVCNNSIIHTPTFSAPTLGGVAMTSCGSAASAVSAIAGGTYAVQAFYLINPPTGTPTLSVSASSGGGVVTNVVDLYANVLTYSGADQTSAIRAGSYGSFTSTGATSGSVVIPSSTTDITVGASASGSFNTPTSNQTLDSFSAVGSVITLGDDHCTTPASSITDTWNYGSSSDMVNIGFSIFAASSPPPPTPQPAIDDYGMMISFGQAW